MHRPTAISLFILLLSLAHGTALSAAEPSTQDAANPWVAEESVFSSSFNSAQTPPFAPSARVNGHGPSKFAGTIWESYCTEPKYESRCFMEVGGLFLTMEDDSETSVPLSVSTAAGSPVLMSTSDERMDGREA